MSHIDSFEHSLVGDFLGLPVYLPLQEINGDFCCTPTQLLIGGGSGEHPALVLERPNAMVARFLDEELPYVDLEEDLAGKWKSVYSPYLESDSSKLFTYYEWDAETHRRFHERCATCATSAYRLFSDRMSLEDWLVLGFGEFVFFSMPELCSEIVGQLANPHEPFHHIRYSNVLVVPPNMPVYANGGNHFFPHPNRR